MSNKKNDKIKSLLAQREVNDEEPASPERRRLLKLGMTAASATVAGVSLVSVIVRMPMPAILPGPSPLIKIGYASAFPIGVEREIEEARLLVRRDEDGLSAMSLVCTHLGCIVKQTQDGFDCPCHGSQFTAEGRVLKGPAPRALTWYRVSELPNKKLVVNTKHPVPMGTKLKLA